MNITDLNKETHEKIIDASKIFLRKEDDKAISLLPALELFEDVKNNNLDDITDIYIFEEGFGNTEVNLKNTILHAITSILSFDYTTENIEYIKDLILVVDDKKSDIALDYFLKIGAYHEKFRNDVLNFVESNINTFTKNKLNTIGFYLASVYDKNENNIELFKLVNKIHAEKFPKKDEFSQDTKTKSQNNPLDEFQNILAQHHNNAVEKVNNELYNEIIKTAKIVEESKDKSDVKEIINSLRERFKNENLNQVTEIFFYCQSFLSSNENPLPMPSQLCISIGKLFSEKNLHYVASKVYSDDEIEGGCALSFLGYLAMHENHAPFVLKFIKENFKGFSHNKKTECVFQLKEILPDNEIAKQIIEESGITKYELIFSTEEDSSSTPITFKFDNTIETKPHVEIVKEPKNKSPWWKFW